MSGVVLSGDMKHHWTWVNQLLSRSISHYVSSIWDFLSWLKGSLQKKKIDICQTGQGGIRSKGFRHQPKKNGFKVQNFFLKASLNSIENIKTFRNRMSSTIWVCRSSNYWWRCGPEQELWKLVFEWKMSLNHNYISVFLTLRASCVYQDRKDHLCDADGTWMPPISWYPTLRASPKLW